MTKLKIDGSLDAESILKININSNLLIKKVMEAKVVISLCAFVVIVFLFFKNISLRKERKELKEALKRREESIKKESSVLESFGQYYVDCDADPLEIEGYTVISHKQIGLWKFNPCPAFYLSEIQKDKNNKTHGTIRGCELYQEITDKNVLNGNVLDFLLLHPGLIPKEWLLPLPFWGSIYMENKTGQCFVRCLVHYLDGVYGHSMHWLGAYLSPEQPAILAE